MTDSVLPTGRNEILDEAISDLRRATSWVIVTDTRHEHGHTTTVLPSDGNKAGRRLLRQGHQLLLDTRTGDA